MILLHPKQFAGTVIRLSDNDEFAVDTCNMFGLASAPGIFGHVADAGLEIFRSQGRNQVFQMWIEQLRIFLVAVKLDNIQLGTLHHNIVNHTKALMRETVLEYFLVNAEAHSFCSIGKVSSTTT